MPSIAVQPLGDEDAGFLDGALAAVLGEVRLHDLQHAIDAAENLAPRELLVRPLRPAANFVRRGREQFRDADAFRVLGERTCSAFSTVSGTSTVRAQYEIFAMWNGNQRGRCMISTGITGTPRHGICRKAPAGSG